MIFLPQVQALAARGIPNEDDPDGHCSQDTIEELLPPSVHPRQIRVVDAGIANPTGIHISKQLCDASLAYPDVAGSHAVAFGSIVRAGTMKPAGYLRRLHESYRCPIPSLVENSEIELRRYVGRPTLF